MATKVVMVYAFHTIQTNRQIFDAFFSKLTVSKV